MTKSFQFKYIDKDSFFHKVTGTSKLLFVFLLSISVLLNQIWYVILILYLFTFLLYLLSKISYSDCYRVQAWTLLFSVLIFLITIADRMNIFQLNFTTETGLYFLEVFLKIRTLFHLVTLFILTTHPAKFAASLNQLGVPYRISYALSQPLRSLLNYEEYVHQFYYRIQSQDYPLVGQRPYLLRVKDYFKIRFLALFQQNQGSDLLNIVKDMHHFGAQSEVMWYYNHKMTFWDLGFLLLGAIILSLSIVITV